MYKLSLLAAVGAMANVATALGNARIVNSCTFPVTAWSAGDNLAGPFKLTPGGGTYGEVFTRDAGSGGRALKVTLEDDGLYTGKPQTIYAYNLNGSTIWYDLSDVFGDPFRGHKIIVASDNASCGQIVMENGVPAAGSQVKNCDSAFNVTMTLCAS
ncbi:hypothetical protein HIM_06785 [Hirsutella minnesotensis 3608]|uniref:Bys1 family protein n=1 Tax=Hirsutella minnesotensis 3608 TaxID=1043627 RepID=A0A0F7ZZA7_9HYPO|nr:hypothetical protein HIM_06785 [Hirsutella minnesotensis 3608]